MLLHVLLQLVTYLVTCVVTCCYMCCYMLWLMWLHVLLHLVSDDFTFFLLQNRPKSPKLCNYARCLSISYISLYVSFINLLIKTIAELNLSWFRTASKRLPCNLHNNQRVSGLISSSWTALWEKIVFDLSGRSVMWLFLKVELDCFQPWVGEWAGEEGILVDVPSASSCLLWRNGRESGRGHLCTPAGDLVRMAVLPGRSVKNCFYLHTSKQKSKSELPVAPQDFLFRLWGCGGGKGRIIRHRPETALWWPDYSETVK